MLYLLLYNDSLGSIALIICFTPLLAQQTDKERAITNGWLSASRHYRQAAWICHTLQHEPKGLVTT